MREALYVKDDDYRLSFLHGNFMTLTNLGEADLARIEELRLAPLYVSLHAWDDEARVALMGQAAGGSRRSLERLAAAGLELHLQIVLCPGWNDGDVLAETVAKAAALPAVADLGIVPVSLADEADLRRVTAADAGAVCAAVAGWQARFRESAAPPSCTPPTSSTCSAARAAGERRAGAVRERHRHVGGVARRGGGAGERVPRGRPAAAVLCGTLAAPVIASVAELLATGGGATCAAVPGRQPPLRRACHGDGASRRARGARRAARRAAR